MQMNDVLDRCDIEYIVNRFYDVMLKDPIVGFIFTDIVQIDLEHHLPIIVDFWADSLFNENTYQGNPLSKHAEVHTKIPLRAGHFTRWLFLFSQTIDKHYEGTNANLMKHKAEQVAKSISASITAQKRSDMNLVLKGESS